MKSKESSEVLEERNRKKMKRELLIIKLRRQQDCTDSAKYSDGKFERVLKKDETRQIY